MSDVCPKCGRLLYDHGSNNAYDPNYYCFGTMSDDCKNRQLFNRITELEAELAYANEVADKQRAAFARATKLWHETYGDNIHPGLIRLCDWLVDRLQSAEAALKGVMEDTFADFDNVQYSSLTAAEQDARDHFAKYGKDEG